MGLGRLTALLLITVVALYAQVARFAYVVNNGAASITAYGIDAATGSLTTIGAVGTGAAPLMPVLDPQRKYLYVPNRDSNTISAFSINEVTGALTSLPGAPFASGTSGPQFGAFDPSGKFLYVSNRNTGDVAVFSADPSTGALTATAMKYALGTSLADLKIHPNGRFLYVGRSGSIAIFDRNTTTGALTQIGPPVAFGGNLDDPSFIAIHPSGNFLYAAVSADGLLRAFRIASNGTLSPIATPGANSSFGVDVDPSGKWLYTSSGGVWGYAIDPTAGTLTMVPGSPFVNGVLPFRLGVDPSGTFLYTGNYGSDNVSGFRINQTTGVLTTVPGSPFPAQHNAHAVVFAGVTPPSCTATNAKVYPTSGGNTGNVTIQILCPGLQPGIQVKLTGIGADIVGTNTTVPNSSVLTTAFDLTGATPGSRTIVLTNPNGTFISLSGVFNVDLGGVANISIDILGRNQIRIGTEQLFYVELANTGVIDTYDLLLLIHVSAGIQVAVANLFAGGIPVTQTSGHGADLGVETVVPVWIYNVPAGEQLIFPVELLAATSGSDVSISAEVILNKSDPFATLGNFTLVPATARLLAKAEVDEALKEAGVPRAASILRFTKLSAPTATTNGCPPNWEYDPVTVQSCQDQIERDRRDDLRDLTSVINPFSVGRHYFVDLLSQLGHLGEAAVGALAIFEFYESNEAANRIVKRHNATRVSSGDPNDKVGATGIGAPRFIQGSLRTSYAIYFDNQSTATAPAQVVSISDTLNGVLTDLDTLIIGPISIVDRVIQPAAIPINSLGGTYSTDVDLRPANNLIVRITVNLNMSSGVVKWIFTSIDPATGQPTTDPLAGFLLPGQEGSISFSAVPKNPTTGAQINNKAAIVFDVNAPIDTPVWSNTFDSTAPTSKVSPLAATQTTVSFGVQWSGTDAGSGIGDYTVYVSDNGSAFVPWLSQTTATQVTYTGVAGHTYRFYSIARDQVGNVEGAKTTAEGATQIVTTNPQIVVTRTLTRNAQSNVVVNVTLANTGTSVARSTLITVATIGTAAAALIPMNPVDISAGLSTTAQVLFPGSVGNPGTAAVLTIGGTYVGGSFNFTSRITLP